MPAPPYPPNVVSGELIASTWGNVVVDRLKGHGALVDGLMSGKSVVNTDSNACVWVVLPAQYANTSYDIQITGASTGTATTAFGRVWAIVDSVTETGRFLVRMFDATTGNALPSAICRFYWQTRGTLA